MKARGNIGAVRTSILVLLVLAAGSLRANDLTLDQRLIVACYNLQVDDAVKCLRKGANVNARFGKTKTDFSFDRWTGGYWKGTEAWTPLLAVAGSRELPDPPADLGEIWKDRARSQALREQIPVVEIEKRRSEALTLVLILLAHGCELENHDGYGATALYKAVDDHKVRMAKTLLEFGANPNTKTGIYIDGSGDTTPLHVACKSQELVQLLLDYGADPLAKDSKGRTPAEWIAWDSKRRFDLVVTPEGARVRPRDNASGDDSKGSQR